MNVEAQTDSWNRLVEGAVTEDFKYVMTASASGVLISNAM
jgi:hypothetical protein